MKIVDFTARNYYVYKSDSSTLLLSANPVLSHGANSQWLLSKHTQPGPSDAFETLNWKDVTGDYFFFTTQGQNLYRGLIFDQQQ